MAALPSREYLLECFDYDKETNTLTWRKRPAEHFDSAANYRRFTTRCAGKLPNKQIRLNGKNYTASKIIFKIVYGHDSVSHIDTKGGVKKTKKTFQAAIGFNNNRFSKSFKTEIEAQEWLKEMRVKFEKNQLPIVKHKKVSRDGLHGVFKRDGKKYESRIGFESRLIYLGRFNTAKKASDAYLLAKQQIKDGVFVPPDRKFSKAGFVGVHFSKNGKFIATYKNKYLGTFDTAEEAHAAYLKAKNHKTFDDGLDILAKLAKEYG